MKPKRNLRQEEANYRVNTTTTVVADLQQYIIPYNRLANFLLARSVRYSRRMSSASETRRRRGRNLGMKNYAVCAVYSQGSVGTPFFHLETVLIGYL